MNAISASKMVTSRIVTSVIEKACVVVRWDDGAEFWFDGELNVLTVADGVSRLSSNELIRRTTVSHTSASCAFAGCEVKA